MPVDDKPWRFGLSLGGIANLDYTALLCNRPEQTTAFDGDAVGFPVVTKRPNWIEFRLGAALRTLSPRTK